MDLSLTSHLVKLAALRMEEQHRAETIKQMRAAFEATIVDDLRNLEGCRRSLEAAEADVRGLTLVAHETTGNVKPAPGVSVVMVKDYEIDDAAALAWAQSTRLCLIPESLDVKAIKKLATVQALPFVTVRQSPSVRIASDLVAALGDAFDVEATV